MGPPPISTTEKLSEGRQPPARSAPTVPAPITTPRGDFHAYAGPAPPGGKLKAFTMETRRDRKRAEAHAHEQFRLHIGDPAPLSMTPQAVFHWNRDDQDLALADVAGKNPDTGFMMRLLAVCTLPRTNPGDRFQYVRTNGPWCLTLSRTGAPRLPFGNLPRLLLAWVCTEAVRRQSRRLELGRSLGEFMRGLGIQSSDSGGRYGVRTRLQNQMERLFNAAVHMQYRKNNRSISIGSLIADETDFWWNPRRPDEPVLWESTIELGEKFYNEIIACPVPVDMNVLRAMKRSPLGLDIYLWLTYRLFTLPERLKLPWVQIYRQFGPNPDQATPQAVHNFRRDFVRELKKLAKAWPDFDYSLPGGALELRPTTPRIAPTTAPATG